MVTMLSTRERIEMLIAMAEQGKFLEAIRESNAEDATITLRDGCNL